MSGKPRVAHRPGPATMPLAAFWPPPHPKWEQGVGRLLWKCMNDLSVPTVDGHVFEAAAEDARADV